MSELPWTKEQLFKANEKLRIQNANYKETLKFYADGKHYSRNEWGEPIVVDDGLKARQTIDMKINE